MKTKKKKPVLLDLAMRYKSNGDELYMHRDDVVTLIQAIRLRDTFDIDDLLLQIKTMKP